MMLSFRSSLSSVACLVILFGASCRSSGDGDDTDGNGGSGASGAQGPGGGAGQGGDGVGGIAGCEGPPATVQEITTGAFGPGSKVSVNGVVAMSHKFLVSHSKTTDNCLWGAFVSAPGLTTTGPNTGLLILSYGTKATIPQGQTMSYCPKLGQEAVGDRIPDNLKPGDKLDVVGVVARFPEDPQCDPPNPPNTVGMIQLGQVCKAEIVGAETPPAPHVLTPAEITSIQSTTDEGFHDQWGGVKVRVENVGVTPQGGQVVGMYGIIKLENGIEVGDKIYYRGYSDNVCHSGPVYTDPMMTFDRVDGFHYLAFCTWGLQANDKCADFSPPSGDCTSATCEPDFLPGM